MYKIFRYINHKLMYHCLYGVPDNISDRFPLYALYAFFFLLFSVMVSDSNTLVEFDEEGMFSGAIPIGISKMFKYSLPTSGTIWFGTLIFKRTFTPNPMYHLIPI